jgi:hypothetical protein
MKFVADNPTYDFKTNLYDNKSGFVGLHIIEFAKAQGWPHEELIKRREDFIADRKKKETAEFEEKQKQQREAEIQRKADTLERVTAIQKSLQDGKKVTFYELIELIKNSTMKVSPRTIGALNKQDDRSYIGTSTASFTKKTSRSTIDSIFEIASQASTTIIKVK